MQGFCYSLEFTTLLIDEVFLLELLKAFHLLTLSSTFYQHAIDLAWLPSDPVVQRGKKEQTEGRQFEWPRRRSNTPLRLSSLCNSVSQCVFADIENTTSLLLVAVAITVSLPSCHHLADSQRAAQPSAVLPLSCLVTSYPMYRRPPPKQREDVPTVSSAQPDSDSLSYLVSSRSFSI